MSKKKKKPQKKRKGNRPAFMRKKNVHKVTLEEKLQKFYDEAVNLETTCNGRCECCKVAMPQLNYCEFARLYQKILDTTSINQRIDIICQCIEYFFIHEFDKFGKATLLKPCMLLDDDGKCVYYDQRPLNCRLYGQWPEEEYESRVDKFAKAYEGKLTRDELPLNKQCPYVERKSDEELNMEIIEGLFSRLDELDAMVGNFSAARIEQKENYRAFHDWVLLTVMGEDALADLTKFMLSADKEAIEGQIDAFKQVIRDKFTKNIPDALKSEKEKEND